MKRVCCWRDMHGWKIERGALVYFGRKGGCKYIVWKLRHFQLFYAQRGAWASFWLLLRRVPFPSSCWYETV